MYCESCCIKRKFHNVILRPLTIKKVYIFFAHTASALFAEGKNSRYNFVFALMKQASENILQ